MATLGDMVSRVRSAFKLVDADNIISNRVVADELQSAALKFIKQQTDKRRLLASDNIFTTIKCLDMEQVPLSSCCSYTDTCMISRSIKRLPKIAENIYGPLAEAYSIASRQKFEYADVDRYVNLLKLYPRKKGLRYWWIADGYVYITDPLIETISFRAFFEEFISTKEYECSNTPSCPENPLELEFKCPGYLETDIVNTAREMIARTYIRSNDDKTVDNNDESNEQTRQRFPNRL